MGRLLIGCPPFPPPPSLPRRPKPGTICRGWEQRRGACAAGPWGPPGRALPAAAVAASPPFPPACFVVGALLLCGAGGQCEPVHGQHKGARAGAAQRSGTLSGEGVTFLQRRNPVGSSGCGALGVVAGGPGHGCKAESSLSGVGLLLLSWHLGKGPRIQGSPTLWCLKRAVFVPLSPTVTLMPGAGPCLSWSLGVALALALGNVSVPPSLVKLSPLCPMKALSALLSGGVWPG